MARSSMRTSTLANGSQRSTLPCRRFQGYHRAQASEQALSESEDQLRAVFNATCRTNPLMADVQTKADSGWAMPRLCHMLGYRLDELLNLKVEDLHTEEDMANVAGNSERQLKGELSLATLPMKRKGWHDLLCGRHRLSR